MQSSDQSRRDRARIEGGVRLEDFHSPAEDTTFHILSAGCIPALTNWNHARVFDPFWRIYFNASAGNGIVFENDRIPLPPRSFVLVPANVLFNSFSGPKPVRHFCIHFSAAPHLITTVPKPLVLPGQPMARKMASDISLRLTRKPLEKAFCRHRCLALLHLLFASILEEHPPPIPQRNEIVKVILAMETNPAAFSNSGQMAKFAGMSDRNFQRCFREARGQSPSTYLREVRLREAARQLVHSQCSIESIADNLGFSNRFHFSRLFREYTGIPPAAFRRDRRAA